MLIAVGANLFLIPNRLVLCGVTGIGTILYYLVGLAVGMITLAINIPLFANALKWAGGTTGGTDIVAKLFRRVFGWKIGHTLLAFNVVILGTSALIFRLGPALYTLLLATVSSRMVNLIQEGIKPSCALWIIIERSEAVRLAILRDPQRGVTVFHGEGGHTGTKKRALLCPVAQSEVGRLERLVSRIDPGAFVILQSASEVIGEGFRGFVAP